MTTQYKLKAYYIIKIIFAVSWLSCSKLAIIYDSRVCDVTKQTAVSRQTPLTHCPQEKSLFNYHGRRQIDLLFYRVMHHSSQAQRDTAIFLAASPRNKSRFPAKERLEAPRSDSQATSSSISLWHFQQKYNQKVRAAADLEEMHWTQIQSHNYRTPDHSCVYEKASCWGQERTEVSGEREPRHIDEFDSGSSNYSAENHRILSNPFLQSQGQFEQGAPSRTSPGNLHDPSFQVKDQHMTYTKEDNEEKLKKSGGKFPWMKNTKSHHYEWKSQWEKGNKLSNTLKADFAIFFYN